MSYTVIDPLSRKIAINLIISPTIHETISTTIARLPDTRQQPLLCQIRIFVYGSLRLLILSFVPFDLSLEVLHHQFLALLILVVLVEVNLFQVRSSGYTSVDPLAIYVCEFPIKYSYSIINGSP